MTKKVPERDPWSEIAWEEACDIPYDDDHCSSDSLKFQVGVMDYDNSNVMVVLREVWCDRDRGLLTNQDVPGMFEQAFDVEQAEGLAKALRHAIDHSRELLLNKEGGSS